MDALTREPVTAPPRSRARRFVVLLLCVLVTVAGGAAIWFWPVAAPEQKAGRRFRDPDQAIPVVEAIATKRDMPVWLDGLGTVQAFQTVTVKSMIDGPLIDVAFKEGQNVKAGDVLARIDPRVYQAALDNAVARKALDEANLANARLDLARYQKLVSTNYATQQQADTARAMVAQLEAQVRQDQAQIDTARTQLSYTTITAPLSGRAGMRMVDPGNIVHMSDSGLLVIAQLQPISVVFSLPQQNLSQVAAAQARTEGEQGAEVIAYTQGADTARRKPLDKGTLTVLDNQIDPATGTIKMKATFPNASGALWPGGFVGVRLRVDTVKDAIVVPQSAVQRGPRDSFVYVVEDNVAHRRSVTIGYEDELGSIVTSGIDPGAHVVVDGASRLTDGAKVSLVRPEDTPAAGANRPAAPGTRQRRPTQPGAGTTGAGQTGAGPTGAGPTGAGTTGAGPTGAGPTGAGPTGARQPGHPGNGQPDSGQPGQSASGQPVSAPAGQAATGHPASGRPASSQPAAGSPAAGQDRGAPGQGGSGQGGSGQGGSGQPRSGQPRSGSGG